MSQRRSTSQLIEANQAIVRLLDLGASTSCCVAFLMSEFQISRAQAYKDVAYCNEERGRQGLHPVEPPTFAVRDTCLRLCMQSLYKAEMAGNVENVARLAKEVRALLSLGAVQQQPNLAKSLFLSHNDPTPPHPTNDTTKETPSEEIRKASESGDWEPFFNSFTETPGDWQTSFNSFTETP